MRIIFYKFIEIYDKNIRLLLASLGIGLTNGFSIVTLALVPSFILDSRVVYQNALAYLNRQTSHQIHLYHI